MEREGAQKKIERSPNVIQINNVCGNNHMIVNILRDIILAATKVIQKDKATACEGSISFPGMRLSGNTCHELCYCESSMLTWILSINQDTENRKH